MPGKVQTNRSMPAKVVIEFLRKSPRSNLLDVEGKWSTKDETCQVVLKSVVPAGSDGNKGLNVQGTLTCAEAIAVDPGFAAGGRSTAVRLVNPVEFQGFVRGP